MKSERPLASWWRLLLVAITLLASTPLLVVTGPSATAAATRPDVGVHFHATWSSYTDAQRLLVLDRLAEAGVEWIRLDLGWASYEEKCSGCRSQWYVDRADRVIDAARARGIKVLAQVGMTPAWANGGQSTGTPPTDPAEFGRFMGWLAGHLKGRVQAYELWNEPNESRFWTGTPAQFARMTHAAYPKVKAADPLTPVVLGGVSYNDSGWLRAAYDGGVRGSFDIMATHPYLSPSDLAPEVPDTRGTNIYTVAHVAAVHSLMTSFGDGGKPIWFTEFGWSSHRNLGGEPNWQRGVTEQQQADYLVRTIDYVAASFPYVTNMFWYADRDRGVSDRHIDNFGILRNDFTPKPAHAALKQRLLRISTAPAPSTSPSPSPTPPPLSAPTPPAAPTTPVLAADSDTGSSRTDRVTRSGTVSVGGTAAAGSVVGVVVDGVQRASVPTTYGVWTASVPLGADGTHRVEATATDAAGLTSARSGALNVTLDTAAPVTRTPVATLVAGGAVSQGGDVPSRLSWSQSGTDDVVLQQVRESRDAGVTWRDLTVATTAVSADVVLPAGSSRVLHQIRMTDRAGNVGLWAGASTVATTVQETAARLTGRGWSTETSSSSSGGRLVHASKGGGGAVFTFTGTSVAWVGHSTPGRGLADVLLDGVKVATVDLYAADVRLRTVQYAARVAPGVQHSLEIRPLGSKRSTSSSRRVDVDALVLIP